MPALDELPDVRTLVSLVGVAVPDEIRTNGVLQLLREAPDADQYLQVRVELPQATPGVMSYLVPRTRIFFNVERSKQLWGDAMVAGAVFAMTQSAPAAFFAASARKLYDNLVLLNDDEAEVVRDVFDLSGGRPYDVPIKEDDLRARFAETLVPLNTVLDSLERKGIVAKRRGGLLLLVF